LTNIASSRVRNSAMLAGMRWVWIVLVGCGHSSTTHGDGAVNSITADEILAACEVADTCQLVVVDHGAEDCLRYFTEGSGLETPEELHCLAAVGGNCDQARACVGETLSTTSQCAPGYTCVGEILSQCAGGGIELDTDCAHSGLGFVPATHCIASTTTAACAIGTCNTGDPDSCDGTKAVRCSNGVAQARDCAALGETCVLAGSAPQTSECGGTGPACVVGTPDRVEGNTIVGCLYGFEHSIDCSVVVPGGTVQTAIDGSGLFCGLGNACVPSRGGEQCTNNVITLCGFGAVRTIDCNALGFTAACGATHCSP
jgi:hypothetical protein